MTLIWEQLHVQGGSAQRPCWMELMTGSRCQLASRDSPREAWGGHQLGCHRCSESTGALLPKWRLLWNPVWKVEKTFVISPLREKTRPPPPPRQPGSRKISVGLQLGIAHLKWNAVFKFRWRVGAGKKGLELKIEQQETDYLKYRVREALNKNQWK